MSFWVYILPCGDDSYYTGHTDDLQKRIAQHEAGEIEGYTAGKKPFVLAFSEEFSTRLEALECERRIKGWSRKKKEALMRGDWDEISRLSRGDRPSTGSGRTEQERARHEPNRARSGQPK